MSYEQTREQLKSAVITARLSHQERATLLSFAEKNNITQTEALRRGIEKLK